MLPTWRWLSLRSVTLPRVSMTVGCLPRKLSSLWLYTFAALILTTHNARGQTTQPGGNSELENSLRKVLEALDTGLGFFESHIEQLNLDAVIGSRLVEGQLSVLQHHLTSSGETRHLVLPPGDLASRIEEVQAKARTLSDNAMPGIAATQAEYYRRIGPIIQPDFWELDYPSRDVDVSLVSTPQFHGEAMHEADSDNCLTEFFGTGKYHRKCHVSRHCWKLMTSPGYRYYSLSHQIFYLQIGESYGCFSGNFLQVADSLAAGFCANILAEAESIADRDFPQDRRDLFMEQHALCGVLGYRQFFRTEWLQKILEWQWQAQGCWGDHNPAPIAGSTGRIKREEKQLPDGCECHRTAVALGALVQYVRYIVEAMQ